jgi:hypothetical protein
MTIDELRRLLATVGGLIGEEAEIYVEYGLPGAGCFKPVKGWLIEGSSPLDGKRKFILRMQSTDGGSENVTR